MIRPRLGLSVVWAVVAGAVSLFAQAPRFVPLQPDVLGAGANLLNAWADIDQDHDLDLFVGFDGAPNRLYRNDHRPDHPSESGVLVDIAAAAGVADARATRAAAWGDADADGDPDLLLGFTPGKGPVLRLYRNTAGRFTDVTAEAGLILDQGAVRQPVWVDADGDGDLDLFVAFRDRPNAFFRNANGRFTDVAAQIGLADPRKSVGAVWFDADEDGDLDVYVANMDGDANGLFRNDSGTFTDIAEAAGLAWGGRAKADKTNGTVRPCAADVDGNGHLDVFTANYGPNGLFLNSGGGRFEDRSHAWGIDIDGRYDSCAFADYDHDGRLDLYVNGTVTGGVSHPDYLFHNTGAGFTEVTPDYLRALQADHGVQWADVDNDGDEDLSLTGSRPDGMHLVLRNDQPLADRPRSIRVQPVDAKDRATLPGAEVRVFATGTSRLLGLRLVDAGSGYDAQSDMPVHVGLPEIGRVDVEVIFPRAGTRTPTRLSNINPRDWQRRPLVVRGRR